MTFLSGVRGLAARGAWIRGFGNQATATPVETFVAAPRPLVFVAQPRSTTFSASATS